METPSNDPPVLTPPHRGALSASRRNFGLDLVRALAVSMVVLGHYCDYPFRSLGGYGVSIFFALSGYLIGAILARQFAGGAHVSWHDLVIFWQRRWYRTLPNYALSLVAFALLASLTIGLVRQAWEFVFFVQNLAWPIPGFFVYSWSLAVEEWFYLLFPLLVFALGKGIKHAFAISVAGFIIVPIALRAIRGDAGFWDEALEQVVAYRLDAIMYGVVMAVVRQRASRLDRLAPALAVAGAAALGAGLLLHEMGRHMPAPRAWLPDAPLYPGVFLTLIPLGCALLLPLVERCPAPTPLLTRGVQRISEWSYSIYLWHMLIYGTVKAIWPVESLPVVIKVGLKVGSLVATLALSRWLYQHFELVFLRRRPSDSREVTMPAMASR